MENENPSYYAIIPANVRYDKSLKANEKLLYGEITCLSQKEGYCFASNNYFAELYEVTPQAISGWVKNLERCGYITCEYLHNGTEIKERRIRIVKDTNSTNDEKGNSTKLEKGINKSLKGYKQKFKDNNTSNNNINYICSTQQQPFQKPTIKEIADYCAERKNKIDPAYFFDYYETKGWKVGKHKMTDWKACIRNWERKDPAEAPKEEKEYIMVCEICGHSFDFSNDWECPKCHSRKISLGEKKAG